MSFPIAARYVHTDAGWPCDRKTAEEHLTPGEVYNLCTVEVGQSCTYLYFAETPAGVGFNSVQFEPVGDDEEATTEWAVTYGCPSGDPNECAGNFVFADEADARECAQWVGDSVLARRTVTTSPWEPAGAEAAS